MLGLAASGNPDAVGYLLDVAKMDRGDETLGNRAMSALYKGYIDSEGLVDPADPAALAPHLDRLVNVAQDDAMSGEAADDALASRGVPSIDLAFELDDRTAIHAIIDELVIRRDRVVLPAALQFGALEPRVIRHDVFDGNGEVERIIDALQFPLVGETAILRQFLWRRLE